MEWIRETVDPRRMPLIFHLRLTFFDLCEFMAATFVQWNAWKHVVCVTRDKSNYIYIHSARRYSGLCSTGGS